MGTKLDKRVTRICGVFTLFDNQDENDIFNRLLLFFETFTDRLHYYMIKHDDADRIHWHYAIICTKAIRLGTMINKIADFMNVDNTQISAESMNSRSAMLTYFLHLDSVDKKQYDLKDIRSDESLQTIADYINANGDELTAIQLIKYVLQYPREFELLVAIGLPLYHKYRYEINMLNDNYMLLSQRYSFLLKENNLPF